MFSFQRREVVLSGQEEKYAQLKHHLVKTVKQSVPIKFVNGFGQQGMDFFTGGSVTLNYGPEAMGFNDGFVSCKHAAFGFT